jgi:hypothetical protein
MDLIDRYVAEVRRYLPPEQRDAVGIALADELRTLVRDSEAHNGRRMTEDELAALIRVRGHPYLLAQPYRTVRYLLIGPSLLPQYWQTLKNALTIAFVAVVVVTAVFAVNGTDPITLLRYLDVFWRNVFTIFIAVTLVFAIFDAAQARRLLKQPWDPRTLPARIAVPSAATPTGSLADVATSGVLLLWWLTIPHYPWVLLGPSARFFTFTNEWHTAYLPVSVCFATALVVHVIPAVRPSWGWLARWRIVLANAASLAGAGLLLRAGNLLASADPSRIDARTMSIVHAAVHWSLIATMIVAAGQLVRHVVGGGTRRRSSADRRTRKE